MDFRVAVPLRVDEGGTIRVGDTRVTLDSVVACFDMGCTAEETVEQFPTLELADVYLVFGFYLRHRAEIEETYLAPRRAEAVVFRLEAQERQRGLRERLVARRQGGAGENQ